jgi:hypothetical protein
MVSCPPIIYVAVNYIQVYQQLKMWSCCDSVFSMACYELDIWGLNVELL